MAIDMKLELPEACKICLKFNPKRQNYEPEYNNNGFFIGCGDCLPKDRATIVLLDKLLNKLS